MPYTAKITPRPTGILVNASTGARAAAPVVISRFAPTGAVITAQPEAETLNYFIDTEHGFRLFKQGTDGRDVEITDVNTIRQFLTEFFKIVRTTLPAGGFDLR